MEWKEIHVPSSLHLLSKLKISCHTQLSVVVVSFPTIIHQCSTQLKHMDSGKLFFHLLFRCVFGLLYSTTHSSFGVLCWWEAEWDCKRFIECSFRNTFRLETTSTKQQKAMKQLVRIEGDRMELWVKQKLVFFSLDLKCLETKTVGHVVCILSFTVKFINIILYLISYFLITF
jgi:hypothetical protein